MASTNKKNKAALSSIKMQAANEVGVPLKDNGYNGDLTSKQAGSIGGQMVKKMIESYEMSNQQQPEISQSVRSHQNGIGPIYFWHNESTACR